MTPSRDPLIEAAGFETEAERGERLTRERAMIEEARADLAAGYFIADGEVDDFLDRLVHGEPLPLIDSPVAARAEQRGRALALPRRFVIVRAAQRDIADARRWLKQPGAGTRAARRLAALAAAIRELRDHPCRWPRSGHPSVRERSIKGYRIIYQIDPDTGNDATAGDVIVLRVFGPGQNRTEPRER